MHPHSGVPAEKYWEVVEVDLFEYDEVYWILTW